MTITELQQTWADVPEFHQYTHNDFTKRVNEVDWMRIYRNFIEGYAFGFGERSFLWLWKLLVDEMGAEFTFLEIGVFRGQILCLVQMLASSTGRSVKRYGVTPLDTSGGVWESDYKKDIETLHDTFSVPKDYELLVGSSTDPAIIEQAYDRSPYDLVYIDGGHTTEIVTSDLKHYAPMVKRGGYLVIDDACNDLKMPWGFFQGIQEVCDATLEYMTQNSDFEFIFSVVHLRIYRRK